MSFSLALESYSYLENLKTFRILKEVKVEVILAIIGHHWLIIVELMLDIIVHHRDKTKSRKSKAFPFREALN